MKVSSRDIVLCVLDEPDLGFVVLGLEFYMFCFAVQLLLYYSKHCCHAFLFFFRKSFLSCASRSFTEGVTHEFNGIIIFLS